MGKRVGALAILSMARDLCAVFAVAAVAPGRPCDYLECRGGHLSLRPLPWPLFALASAAVAAAAAPPPAAPRHLLADELKHLLRGVEPVVDLDRGTLAPQHGAKGVGLDPQPALEQLAPRIAQLHERIGRELGALPIPSGHNHWTEGGVGGIAVRTGTIGIFECGV
jgi:hypothetical protein